MEAIFIITVGCILAAATVFMLAGIILRDIAVIRQEAKYGRPEISRDLMETPRTLRDLWRLYRHVVAAPFDDARSGFGVSLQTGSPVSWRHWVYVGFRGWVRLANFLAFVYAAYVAFALYEPTLFISYLGAFGVYLLMAIWQYRYFSWRQKIGYTLLAPVSLGYFMWLLPLRRTRRTMASTSPESSWQPTIPGAVGHQ